MKKTLLLLSAIALVLWVASWFRAEDAVETSGARPWPAGLGTLQSALDRYPPVEANDAARKLTTLANAVPKSEAVDAFVLREIARGEVSIGTTPAVSDVAAMRELLLREHVVWARRLVEVGDQETIQMRAMLMNAARALVASALSRARTNDAAAWDDLHAVWRLARSLDGHPQVMLQTAAMTMSRMINAVAWKMPSPAPAWFGELQRRDSLEPLLAAFHHQAASYWKDGAQLFPTKWLASSVEHDRAIAEELLTTSRCNVSVRANQLGTDLSSVWRRAFRYRAEREATANAMRIRRREPIEAKSVCTDGTWSFDGTTLRFSQDIPSISGDVAMPLVLRVERQ